MGVLPRGANRALDLRRDGAEVGAEVVGDDLLLIVAKQSGLRREEDKPEASARGLADVILRAGGVTHEERLGPRWHLNVAGHGWWCDGVGVGRLRDREGRGESSGARDEQKAMRGLILQCIRVLHIILLSSLTRGLWGATYRRFHGRARTPLKWGPSYPACKLATLKTPSAISPCGLLPRHVKLSGSSRSRCRSPLPVPTDLPLGKSLGAMSTSETYWTTMQPEDNGNGRRRWLGRTRLQSRGRKNDVHVEADQLGSKVGKSLKLRLGIPVLDSDVLTLDVAQLSQPSAERLIPRGVHGRAARCENPDV